MLLAAPLGGGCGGGGGSPTGGGGSGGGGGVLDPNDKISDFEDIAAATVVNAGTPPPQRLLVLVHDVSPTCVQTPIDGGPYLPLVAADFRCRPERRHGAARGVGRLHGVGRRRRR